MVVSHKAKEEAACSVPMDFETHTHKSILKQQMQQVNSSLSKNQALVS